MAKKKLEKICFPVPQHFMTTPTTPTAPAPINSKVKESIFRQTLQTAFQIKIPYSFESSYQPEKPHQLATDDQVALIASLFEALNPLDAVEMALAQQFIILHIQAINAAKGGIGDRDMKRFELTHKILETIQKYKTKGAQLIQVQYNHNQGQINNINVKGEDKNQTLEVV
jgi:hypothetical protein